MITHHLPFYNQTERALGAILLHFQQKHQTQKVFFSSTLVTLVPWWLNWQVGESFPALQWMSSPPHHAQEVACSARELITVATWPAGGTYCVKRKRERWRMWERRRQEFSRPSGPDIGTWWETDGVLWAFSFSGSPSMFHHFFRHWANFRSAEHKLEPCINSVQLPALLLWTQAVPAF